MAEQRGGRAQHRLALRHDGAVASFGQLDDRDDGQVRGVAAGSQLAERRAASPLNGSTSVPAKSSPIRSLRASVR